MVNRILTTLLLIGSLATFAATAQTTAAQDQSSAVRALLQQRDQEIKTVLGNKETFTDAQRQKLKDVVNSGIDFEAMGRTALGPFWNDITPAERKNFVDVFSSIVRSQSLSNLSVYRTKVIYKDVTVEGDSAYALTSTVYKDVPTDVAYVLGNEDGEWLVHDIIIDDVSTAEGYARSFQTVIRKKGFDALMQSLNKKLDKMSS